MNAALLAAARHAAVFAGGNRKAPGAQVVHHAALERHEGGGRLTAERRDSKKAGRRAGSVDGIEPVEGSLASVALDPRARGDRARAHRFAEEFAVDAERGVVRRPEARERGIRERMVGLLEEDAAALAVECGGVRDGAYRNFS
jgi:hypothetical protein